MSPADTAVRTDITPSPLTSKPSTFGSGPAARKRKAHDDDDAEDGLAEPHSDMKPRRLAFASKSSLKETDPQQGNEESSSENMDDDEDAELTGQRQRALANIAEEDADVFKNKYALALPSAAPTKKNELQAIQDDPGLPPPNGEWAQLPEGIRVKLEKMDADLIEVLPTSLPPFPAGIQNTCGLRPAVSYVLWWCCCCCCFLRSDFPHFVDILMAEGILNLTDATELICDLEGFCAVMVCPVSEVLAGPFAPLTLFNPRKLDGFFG